MAFIRSGTRLLSGPATVAGSSSRTSVGTGVAAAVAAAVSGVGAVGIAGSGALNAGPAFVFGSGGQAPVFVSTPSPTFTEGVSGSYDFKQDVDDDFISGVSWSLSNEGGLSSGLSFDPVNGTLNYTGIGSPGSSLHTLTATDAVGSDVSSLFSAAIVSNVIATQWLGIPDPTAALGYDPINVVEPIDPAPWPSAESVGNYYIDSSHGSATDSGNTYGYPNQPRLTIPTSLTINGGDKCVVVGDSASYPGANITITPSGASAAAGNQAWFVGRSATDITVFANRPDFLARRIVQNGQFIVISDVKVSHQDNEVQMVEVNNFGTLRNFEFAGTGVTSTGSGATLVLPSNSCAYNGEIHDHGNWQVDNGADLHGCKSAGSTVNAFYLSINGYRLQGDTIQIGDANGDAAALNHIYLGDIFGHDNKENCIDIKRSTDVIISGGEGYDMAPGAESNGEETVIHDNANFTWVIGRVMRQCNRGIETSGSATNQFAVGCEFRDITQVGGSGGVFADAGVAVLVRGGDTSVVNCTFYNCRKSIEFDGLSAPGQIRNNIFYRRNTDDADNWDIIIENSGVLAALDTDYNMFDQVEGFRCRGGGTNYTSLASWQSATGGDANSSIDNPLFTDENNADFTLQNGSPAIDAGDPTEADAYAIFEARYGLDIRKDKALNDRPSRAEWYDLGAHENPTGQNSTIYEFDTDLSAFRVFDDLTSGAQLTASASGGRYVGDLNSNPSNGTEWFNSLRGLGHYVPVSFPFEVIAYNIGISPPGNPTGDHNPGGTIYNFCGMQVQNESNADPNTWGALNSAHGVLGHRGSTHRTVEGKNTVSGSSSVNDEGANAITVGRGYLRVVGEGTVGNRTLTWYWKDNLGDAWTIYRGTGKFPGAEVNWGEDVHVGLITYAENTGGVPFDGVCDSLEVI